jgi:outer membrane protein assembly factor BamB
VLALAGCGSKSASEWTSANGNLAGTRAVDAAIDAGNVATLRPRWRFRITAKTGYSGRFVANPVVADGVVYVQDTRSDVYALDLETGRVRWSRRFDAHNDGPNGVAVDGDRLYGATDSDAFALDARTGHVLWTRHLTGVGEQFVDVPPVPWHGLVLTSTVGFPAFGRGAIYALDADDGSVRWRFDTIKGPWRYPREAGGGGLWNPVSVDEDGRVYGGNSNPAPWGGTPERPNGGAFPGPALYTDSLLVLDGDSGELLWYDQVTPHDVRDYDFEATPILAEGRVFGAGKAGLVIAWDRETQKRVWQTPVGLHANDVGPLPRERVTICPGLLGGVETQMAYAGGRLFVPVVDLCVRGSAVSYDELDQLDPARGRGALIALGTNDGRPLWSRSFRSPLFGCATVSRDVVFTSTYSGMVYGLSAEDGTTLWRARMGAGINACPAIADEVLLVGAGIPRAGGETELVAFGLPR